MSASDYPVNFPYGATSYPYGTAAYPYHRGNDRACPTGTPVIIGSTTIGLTGATGKVTGPHLHIQEWSGSPTNDRKPQNEFKPGKVTQTDYTGGTSFGKYVTIQTADGWNDSYCHLSTISVKVGDVIGGSVSKDSMTDGELSLLHSLALFSPVGPSYLEAFRGRTFMEAANNLRGDAPYANPTRRELDKKLLPPTSTEIKAAFAKYGVQGNNADGTPTQKQIDYYKLMGWRVLLQDLAQWLSDHLKESGGTYVEVPGPLYKKI